MSKLRLALVPDHCAALNYKDWPPAMASRGVSSFDAAEYHIWSSLYRADDTYAIFLGGRLVQESKLKWTISAKPDVTWSHTKIDQVNRPLDASAVEGKYYE